jgi:cytochrome c2
MEVHEKSGVTMNNKLITLFVGLALAPFAWPLPSSSAPVQVRIIPGSSVSGARIFRDKGCVSCHDSDRLAKSGNPAALAAGLWNHSPEMWLAQRGRNIQPFLSSTEVSDLFAYFFSLAYANTPGDPARGRAVFDAKTCSRCHDTEVGQRRAGPPVSTWSEVDDPLSWAERMWNHSRTVAAEVSGNGLRWPEFSTQEMVDMLAYLRSVSRSTSQPVFQPGNPELGRVTFENACESCHSFGSRTAKPKIDLLKRPAPELMTGYVTAMWNHAPLMQQRAGQAFPILGPGDMANLVAYLFTRRYFDQEGNPGRGARVFESKGCASCHDRGRHETGAPDLTASTERYSPVTVAASLFRHGPSMLETMRSRNVKWPQFTMAEMQDLIGFLNSRLVRLAAGPQN